MKIINRNEFYIAFDKTKAIEMLEEIKNSGNVCVIDFESFQIPYRWNYNMINIRDVPFCVGVATLKYVEIQKKWIVENESVYSFKADKMSENNLVNKIKEMAEWIENYCRSNNIEQLLALANYNEVCALNWMNNNGEYEWINYLLSRQVIDLYDFFNKSNAFRMIHYNYKFRYYGNRFMIREANDKISNHEIGVGVSKHFQGREEFSQWDQTKQHNLNDLGKAAWMVNDLEYLININEEEFLN